MGRGSRSVIEEEAVHLILPLSALTLPHSPCIALAQLSQWEDYRPVSGGLYLFMFWNTEIHIVSKFWKASWEKLLLVIIIHDTVYPLWPYSVHIFEKLIKMSKARENYLAQSLLCLFELKLRGKYAQKSLARLCAGKFFELTVIAGKLWRLLCFYSYFTPGYWLPPLSSKSLKSLLLSQSLQPGAADFILMWGTAYRI